jgi:cytochrome b561
MLALPLPSDDFRYREFPFQLHKNLGITILLLLIAVALIRLTQRQPQAALPAESAAMTKLRTAGHVLLYGLIFAVCITGYLSSSYSGWGTELWWLFVLPYWGHENEELNQLYSDLHQVACWGLLLAMAAHIGAALLHAFRNDGVIRRILRW